MAQFKATRNEMTEFLEAAKKWHKTEASALESFLALGSTTAKVQSTDADSHASLRAFGTFVAEAHTAQATRLAAFKIHVRRE